MVLVEILSPSLEERDPSVKPAEYLEIASLDSCIVASQDGVLFCVWQRRPDGTFNEAPLRIEGRDQVIQVPGLDLAIPLAEVYRGIDI